MVEAALQLTQRRADRRRPVILLEPAGGRLRSARKRIHRRVFERMQSHQRQHRRPHMGGHDRGGGGRDQW